MNKLLVTIGSDMERPGKFFWNIKDAATREVIVVRRDLPSLDAARKNFQTGFAAGTPCGNAR